MKRYINYWMAALCALILAACSTDAELAQTNLTSSHIHVGTFPSFGEAQTRSVGTFDAGKTEWADGDQIFVQITNPANPATPEIQSTLIYNSTTSEWSWSKEQPKTNLTTATVTAYYAPAYEWSNGTPSTLALKSGKTAGTDEYLVYTATDVPLANGISINFSGAGRTYSRLRIVGAAGKKVTLTSAAFTAAGATAALGDGTLTTTTDSKGNAYFYGSWTADAQLGVSVDGSPAISKTIATAGIAGSSYAWKPAFMRFTINSASADTPFNIPFPTSGTTPAEITVYWGDGTEAVAVPAGTALSTGDAFDHTYSSTGDFTITIVSSQSDDTKQQIPSFNFFRNRNTDSNATKVKSMDTPLLNMATESFLGRFMGCSNLTTISAGLFDKNTAVINFTGCFGSCSNLTTIPEGLFGKNTAVTTFSNCFSYCTKLKLNENIFIDGTTTTEANRFNQVAESIDFTDCFDRCGSALQPKQGGTAPALWDYAFASTPTTKGCFYNVTSVTNVGDILDAWKQ